MKGISIWQPHASLLVGTLLAGSVKPFETRSWPAHKALVGQRIWIHAAKAMGDLLELAEYNEERRTGGVCDERLDAYLSAIASLGFKTLSDLPCGALIGTAVLEASIPTETLVAPGPFGDFSPGRFAWRMGDHLPLAEPIPFRGMQGFFDVPSALGAGL